MFTWLGKFTTRHPIVVIISWVVAVALSGVAVLWGFGQGGLFQRMETSEFGIPGTDSEKVMHLTEPEEEGGPVSLLAVTGVPVDSDEDRVAQFAKDNRDLFDGEYVESVSDAFLISEKQAEAEAEAEAKLTDTIAEQVEKAMAPITEQAQSAQAQAEAQIQAQVDQAALAGPDFQAAAEAQAQEARAQLAAETKTQLDQARAQVQTQVEQEVRRQADEARNTPEAQEQLAEVEQQRQSLLSNQGTGYVVVVTRQADLDQEQLDQSRVELDEATDTYRANLQAEFPGADIQEMSEEHMSDVIMATVQSDLVKGETLGLPVAALLMLIVFGGAIAAGMPLIGAISAIAAGMGALWVSTFVTTVDSFILNVVSIIGVALSIDYGLLVVSRFREESRHLQESLGEGRSAHHLKQKVVIPGVLATVQTAGRTVLFSAVTITFSLAGLLLMRIHMLQMIAWGGIVVTLLAVLAAITLVPALLTLWGRKLLKPSPIAKIPGVGRLIYLVGDHSTDHGFFAGLAKWVQRRPWLVMIGVGLALVAMALPLRGLELRNNFSDYIPDGTPLRSAYDTIEQEYPSLASPSVSAVVDADNQSEAVTRFIDEVEAIPGVETVTAEPLERDEDLTLVQIRVDSLDQAGPEVTEVMLAVRDLDVGTPVWVGGSAAGQWDFTHAIAQDAPWALAVVAAAVMILLFLMTGSLVVPIRALIINALSLLASLGVTTAIFEHGWFGVPQTSGLVTFIVACMIAFGFGLAMDYEVFLLARIKEYWDQGLDNNTAVARGLQRSGRIITSAAAIIVAVFIGFSMGEMVAIKQIGVALAIMVITDATLTRLFLVPATMTVLGKWNWWAPKPLARLAEKIGLRE